MYDVYKLIMYLEVHKASEKPIYGDLIYMTIKGLENYSFQGCSPPVLG
jgi:hypothetical protein